jgi:hypothetical protein
MRTGRETHVQHVARSLPKFRDSAERPSKCKGSRGDASAVAVRSGMKYFYGHTRGRKGVRAGAGVTNHVRGV